MDGFLRIIPGSFCHISRIVCITAPTSKQIIKMIACADEKNLLVNVTEGKPRRSVIFMDDGRLIVTPVKPETLISRIHSNNPHKVLDGDDDDDSTQGRRKRG